VNSAVAFLRVLGDELNMSADHAVISLSEVANRVSRISVAERAISGFGD